MVAKATGPPLWSRGNLVTSHAAGPGSVPSRVNLQDEVPRGFPSTVRQMSGNLGHIRPRLSYGHHTQYSIQTIFIRLRTATVSDLRCSIWLLLNNKQINNETWLGVFRGFLQLLILYIITIIIIIIIIIVIYYYYYWGRRVIGSSGSLIWSKTLMELIFNSYGEFRWSPECPVSQIHSPHLRFGAPEIFSVI